MNLDDLTRFRQLDSQNMISHIDRLPDQLEAAWTSGQTLPLPGAFKRIERIVIAAMMIRAIPLKASGSGNVWPLAHAASS